MIIKQYIKDFENLLQLNYLYFTAPRHDEEAYQMLLSILDSQLANRDKNPKAAFSDSINMIASNHSPRTIIFNKEALTQANLNTALAILENTSKAGADPIKKVVLSAAANAEHNMGMDKEDLYVAECFADGGQMLKRMQPVSKGRGHAILKRTSHITVVLDAAK